MKKTKKVVAQHIPFWVECMFLVETPYCSDVWRQFKHPSDLSVCWDAYQFLNQSSLNTVIFRILVVRLFCWSPKCDSATVGEKREWRKEKNERKKTGWNHFDEASKKHAPYLILKSERKKEGRERHTWWWCDDHIEFEIEGRRRVIDTTCTALAGWLLPRLVLNRW